MIREISSEMHTLEAFKIYASCMYRPSLEEYTNPVDKYLSDTETHCFGYFEGSRLWGVIVIRKGEILGIAVLNALRKRGAGHALIDHVQKLYPVLTAETDEDSVGFYHACGFSCEAFERTFPDGAVTRYKCIINSF